MGTVCVALSLLSGCAIRPSTVRAEQPTIMVKSVRLPVRDWLPWFARFAEHTWIDFHYAGTWHRVEWDNLDHIRMLEMSATEAFEDQRWERDVAVHEQFAGEWTTPIMAKILEVAESYEYAKGYLPWPGPNSNTFMDWLAHEVGLPIVLPPAAVGKDYTTWLRPGLTATHTGIELETMLLGAEIGLREGIELHALGLTAGIGFWPPAIKLPFLPAIPGGWFGPVSDEPQW
tara:strand:- start:7054 stop:7743 length:690 start_codon:yes stop_codon:yes gene_type:complete